MAAFDAEQQKRDYEDARGQLNADQLRALDAIRACLDHHHPRSSGGSIDDITITDDNHRHLFFVDGPAGTGKTRLFNTVLQYARGHDLFALPVATSAVAAQLLPGGRTAHSRFGIPVHHLTEESTCSCSVQDRRAKLIRAAHLIIWDEAVMISRLALQAVDRLFQDIMGSDRPFGGKIMV
ncbi:PIF1-like helicase-domain-containing protein, partial [Gongronella butleri]